MDDSYLSKITKLAEDSYLEHKDSLNINSESRLDFLRFKSSYKAVDLSGAINDDYLLSKFLTVKANQARAEFDIYEKTSYENLSFSGTASLDRTPKIFCSFHLGSYTIIPLILLKNFKLALVVNQKTLKTKGNIYKEIVGKSNLSDFEIIDAENENSMIHMIRKLKQGFSLMFYIDGNTGAGGFERKDNKLVKISFLNNQILARKGVAYLAFKLKLPIVPIYTYRLDTDNIIHVDPEIKIDQFQTDDSQEFCQSCTQAIWQNFEQLLIKFEEQWEGWQYLYSFFVKEEQKSYGLYTESSIKHHILVFPNEKDLFVRKGKYYTYDYIDFDIHEISKTVFTVLSKMQNNDLQIKYNDLCSVLPSDLILNLVNNKILILKS